MLSLPLEIWFGTSSGDIIMVDKESRQIIRSISLQSNIKHKLVMISVDNDCVWVAIGTSIFVLSIKVKMEIFGF